MVIPFGVTFQHSKQRRLLVWLCALKLAAIILVFDPSGLVAFQLPKALASRAFEWLIAAALLLALVSYGRRVLRPSRVHIVVLALVVTSALSAAFAADRYVALFGDPENYAGLAHVIDMAVLYVAVAVAVREERDAFVLLGAIVAAGGIAIVYGAVQALGADPYVWAVDPRERPFSTFGNPDHFGHFLSLLFGIALGLVIGAPRWRSLGAVLGIATVGMAAVVATRGTLIGIAAAIGGATLTRLASARWAAAVGAGGILLAAALLFTPLGQRAFSGTIGDRLILYGIAAQAAVARPILGYGTDNFRVAFAAHRTVESLAVSGSGPQATAHDWVLDAAATTGAIGLAALVALVALGTLELWRLARARPAVGAPLFLGWLAYWGHAFVAAYSLAGAWFPFVALGVAAALRAENVDTARRRAAPAWAIVLFTVGALVGAATGARAFQADRDAWASEEARHFGDAAAAVDLADRAAARDGGRAEYWNLLGLALDAAGRRDDAAEAYGEAARRAPHEAVYWGNYARGLARIAGADAAKRDGALAAARQAIAVDPHAPVGHLSLSEIAIAFGRCDLARTEAATVAALEPGHDDLVKRATDCR